MSDTPFSFLTPEWMTRGLCRGAHTEDFYPTRGKWSAANYAAADLCKRCPVRDECLQYALDHDEIGIWGATSGKQRRRIKREQERSHRASVIFVPVHGTRAGYQWHIRAGLQPCEPCAQANRDYKAARTAAAARTSGADTRQGRDGTPRTEAPHVAGGARQPHASRTAASVADPSDVPAAGFALGVGAEHVAPLSLVSDGPAGPAAERGVVPSDIGVGVVGSGEVVPAVGGAGDTASVGVQEQCGDCGCAHVVSQPQTAEGVNHKYRAAS